jgi:hypothetical protein
VLQRTTASRALRPAPRRYCAVDADIPRPGRCHRTWSRSCPTRPRSVASRRVARSRSLGVWACCSRWRCSWGRRRQPHRRAELSGANGCARRVAARFNEHLRELLARGVGLVVERAAHHRRHRRQPGAGLHAAGGRARGLRYALSGELVARPGAAGRAVRGQPADRRRAVQGRSSDVLSRPLAVATLPGVAARSPRSCGSSSTRRRSCRCGDAGLFVSTEPRGRRCASTASGRRERRARRDPLEAGPLRARGAQGRLPPRGAHRRAALGRHALRARGADRGRRREHPRDERAARATSSSTVCRWADSR